MTGRCYCRCQIQGYRFRYGCYRNDFACIKYNVFEGSTTSFRYAADVNLYVFDWNTTNQAGVVVESIGSVQKSSGTDTYLVSFAYDTDDYVITDIFFNKRPATLTTASLPSSGGSTADATVTAVNTAASVPYITVSGNNYDIIGSAYEFFNNGT
jgi:hypothetical protein